MKMKTILLASTTMLALAPFAAMAQTAPASPPPATEAKDVEVIIVTGSRIARIAETSPVPVTVISAATLEAKGVTQVSDLLEQLPALSSSTTGDQATGVPGRPTLNLRGLGSARTLVLVNGRRHVAGVAGSSAVDISTIPSALVERVDVLTGGASAVYGSDAVSGVVNFITKRKYEGTELVLQGAMDGQGDAPGFFGSLTYGRNFGESDKGNFTLALQYDAQEMLMYGERDFSKDNGIAFNTANPALFFQAGDPIPTGRTANNTLGQTILNGSNPRYANTDPALLARARSSTPRAILGNRTFSISSLYGLIGLDPTGFGFADGASALPGADFNGNGTNDCLESAPGRRFFGCWVVDPVTNKVRPFKDGLYSGSSNQIGGDGAPQFFNDSSMLPTTSSFVANFLVDYEINANARPYAEFKFVQSEALYYGVYKTFDDTILIRRDNPFIPTELRNYINGQIAADPRLASTYQLMIGRDNIDIVRNDKGDSNSRNTVRFVGGVDGQFFGLENWKYDLSVNYGRTQNDERSWTRLDDRYFAAIDAVIDPATGQPTCRSNLNPNALPPSPAAQFPYIEITKFTTFDPRNKECRPLNLFGLNKSSQEAREFVSYEETTKTVLEQTVVNFTLVGDSEKWFSLPGGPIAFALGGEYREESSDFTPDPFESAGETFDEGGTQRTVGSYDVKEAFIELNLPVLKDAPFAETLEVSAAARWGDYSTIGKSFAWKADMTWAPVNDIRFRGGYSVTVRAPNIDELFSPEQPVTFSPIDPCDNAQIGQGRNPANRRANCLADGIPSGWTNPNTARFTGVSGGNPNLGEETAETITAGLVLRPRFLSGFVMTLDYYSIKIEDAIASVSGQNIVDACYDAPSLNNPFCASIRRNRNTNSQTFLGLNFIRQGDINFASLEAEGVDLELRYRLPLEIVNLDKIGDVRFSLLASKNLKRENYENPNAPTDANVILGELNQPEWIVMPGLNWSKEKWSASWSSRFISDQTLFGVGVEDFQDFTPAFTGDIWIHDASLTYNFTDESRVTLGVSNLTDEEPYLRELAEPVSGVGREFFVRFSTRY
jgi:iron complex outermembrane recepter protein